MSTPPPGRPARADALRNYEHIVETARVAFTEQGPEVSLNAIAQRAGIGAGTLYRHFPSREALIEAVYRGDIAALTDRAVELSAAHDPLAALESWVREQLVPAQQRPGIATTLKDALARAPEAFSPSKERFNQAADSLVGAAQAVGAIRRDVETRDILRMAAGIAASSDGDPAACKRMLTIMFDGLRPVSL